MTFRHYLWARLRWLLLGVPIDYIELGLGAILLCWGLWSIDPHLAGYTAVASFQGMRAVAPIWLWGASMLTLGFSKWASVLLAGWPPIIDAMRWVRMVLAVCASFIWGALIVTLLQAPVLAPGAGITFIYLAGSALVMFRQARGARPWI